MQMHTIWSDRGTVHEACGPPGAELPALMLASRDGSLAVAAAASAWLVLRGGARLECREGRFSLAAGQWLVLEAEARPLLHADDDGLVAAITFPPRPGPGPGLGLGLGLAATGDGPLFPGLGSLAPGARAAALRLWRGCAPFARNVAGVHTVDRPRLEAVLRLLAAQQAGLRGLVDRCPGRSLHRRRQMFTRMQRAWLYLAGNLDRPVRLAELAERGNVSIWHFTKTFHALYGEGPQAASSRMRLAKAARLLRSSRLSIGEAGAACGFENNCSFSRAFRAHFGVPPSLYRAPADGAPEAANQTGTDGQAVASLHP